MKDERDRNKIVCRGHGMLEWASDVVCPRCHVLYRGADIEHWPKTCVCGAMPLILVARPVCARCAEDYDGPRFVSPASDEPPN